MLKVTVSGRFGYQDRLCADGEQRETDALFISYYLIELFSRNNVPDKEEGGIRIPFRSALCDRLCSWVGIALQRRC
jgi:hypothetical protein